MATNEILPFCPTDTGTNLLTEVEYTAAADRTSGNKPGVASSKLNNKALRQATLIASQFAQFISDTKGVDVLDNGSATPILSKIKSALIFKQPVLTVLISGSGTWNKTYKFAIATGSATIGATYTNNAVTYTVSATVASGTELIVTGGGDPTANGGTLTKTSGTGDATITFNAFTAALYLEVEMIGGGGGGAGSGTTNGAPPTAGGNTTFGTSLLAANGGSFNVNVAGTGGSGGSASITAPAFGINLSGGSGQSGATNSGLALAMTGGNGAFTPFGGAGAGGPNGGNGVAAAVNSGAGGGGGGTGTTANNGSGAGGGGGGWLKAIIPNPSASYSYAVGSLGNSGAAGGGATGHAGGNGGSGVIIIKECFQ